MRMWVRTYFLTRLHGHIMLFFLLNGKSIVFAHTHFANYTRQPINRTCTFHSYGVFFCNLDTLTYLQEKSKSFFVLINDYAFWRIGAMAILVSGEWKRLVLVVSWTEFPWKQKLKMLRENRAQSNIDAPDLPENGGFELVIGNRKLKFQM